MKPSQMPPDNSGSRLPEVAPIENQSPEVIAQRILTQAHEADIALNGVRRTDLIARAVGYQAQAEIMGSRRAAFSKDGLLIGKPIDEEGVSTSRVDFMPTPLGVRGGQPSVSRAVRSADLGLRGLRGIQDYVLLCEAGFIERPALLKGTTHGSMARATKRFGFVYEGDRTGELSVSYKTLRERVFSEKLRKFEETLGQRVGKATLLLEVEQI